jgi:mannose-1-phosphate guanylyltransferase
MILCAGLGTRLRPLTDACAKPLVPVGDRPALAHILEKVGGPGRRVVVNAHHRAGDVRAFAAAWKGGGEVLVSEETELLGTAGGVERAAGLLGPGDVLVWNGDILAPELDPGALVAAAHASGADAMLVVGQRRAAGEGNLGLDAEGRVVRIRRETRREGEVAGADFVPIHVVGAGIRARLPAQGCFVADVYLPAIASGARLLTFPYGAGWIDVGSVAEYRAANEAWLRARGIASWVAPSARVAPGVRVVGSIVGNGARVEGEGELARCIVWPGAVARAPLDGAIVSR